MAQNKSTTAELHLPDGARLVPYSEDAHRLAQRRYKSWLRRRMDAEDFKTLCAMMEQRECSVVVEPPNPVVTEIAWTVVDGAEQASERVTRSEVLREMQRPSEWVYLGKRSVKLPTGITASLQLLDADGKRPAWMRSDNEDAVKRALGRLTPAERDLLDEVVADGRYLLHTNATLLIDFLEDERAWQALPQKRGPDGATQEQMLALNDLYEDMKKHRETASIATFVQTKAAQAIFQCSASTFSVIRRELRQMGLRK